MASLRHGVLHNWRMLRFSRSISKWVMTRGFTQSRITTSSFAALMGVTGHDIYNYFNCLLGVDFRTWLTRLRLEEAKHLMDKKKDVIISDIAKEVGFSDRSNFSRQFLLYTGMTPNAWRHRKNASERGGDVNRDSVHTVRGRDRIE